MVDFKVPLFEVRIIVLKTVTENQAWFLFSTDTTFKLSNASLLLYCNDTLLTDKHTNIQAFHHLSGCWKLQVQS